MIVTKIKQSLFDTRMLKDSITKLNPVYLAKKSPVMFTVEMGFFLVFAGIYAVGLRLILKLRLKNPASTTPDMRERRV